MSYLRNPAKTTDVNQGRWRAPLTGGRGSGVRLISATNANLLFRYASAGGGGTVRHYAIFLALLQVAPTSIVQASTPAGPVEKLRINVSRLFFLNTLILILVSRSGWAHFTANLLFPVGGFASEGATP